MDREQASRRVRAAMALAGYRSVPALAADMTDSKVGLKRLHQLIQKKGDEPTRGELREIAGACHLPYAFFTFDFATLDGDANEVLARRLADLEAEMPGLRQGLASIEKTLASEGLERLLAALGAESASGTQTATPQQTPPSPDLPGEAGSNGTQQP